MQPKRAIVIGAGPGGLYAAIVLRDLGWSVQVFERASDTSMPGAGLTLWTNALLSLKSKTLADSLIAKGAALETLFQRNISGHGLSQLPLGPWSRSLGAPTICLPRSALLQTLQEELPKEEVSYGTAFQCFEEEGASLKVTLSGQREERCDLLIGADGLRSLVRQQLLGESAPRYAGRTSWRGLTRFSDPERLPSGVCYETFGAGSRFGLFPVGDGVVYWYLTKNGPPSTQTGKAPKSQLLSMVKDWPAPTSSVIDATAEHELLQTDIYDRPAAPFWSKGRATLLGDAAHPMTPDLGQGACQALEDAACLGYHLQRQEQLEEALLGYQRERLARTSALVIRASRMGWARQFESGLIRGFRDFALRLMPTKMAFAQLAPVVAFRAPWMRKVTTST